MFDDYGKDYFYEIYVTKNPAEAVLEKIRLFASYEIGKKETFRRRVTYLDTPSHNLEAVNLLLSVDIIDGKGELTLERNLENEANVKYIRMLETYQKSAPFNQNNDIDEYIPFLRDSLRSFFSQPLDFDSDHLFKKVQKTYVIDSMNESYKIVNFSGFKCWLTIEHTTFTNASNGRQNYVTYVKVKKAEDSKENDMQDFIAKLEKYCKRITKLNKTKYSECVRLTRDIDVIINKKKKLNKSRKSLNNTEEEYLEQQITSNFKNN